MAAPNEARPLVGTERAQQEHTTPSDSASIGAESGLDKFDDAEAARAAIEQRDKLIATLKARAALHGYVVHIIGSEGHPVFLPSRAGAGSTRCRPWTRSKTS